MQCPECGQEFTGVVMVFTATELSASEFLEDGVVSIPSDVFANPETIYTDAICSSCGWSDSVPWRPA